MDKYVECVRYKKMLTYKSHHGNSNIKYVQFADEDGIVLNWVTKDYVEVFKNLKEVGVYTFTVKSNYNGNIDIRNVKMD